MFKQLTLPFNLQAAEKIDTFVQLLQKWNARINLTASDSWESIEPLLLEGLWASKIYPEEAKNHLDIGSGAGFPAIPLKIMVPGIKLAMVDSRLKRISFLETVASALKLSNTSAFHCRINDYLELNNRKWDCISWKGIKIDRDDFLKINRHAHKKTQFWMFHGKEIAAEEPEIVDRNLRLIRKERFPYKSEWMLSVYIPK